jgi:hypothetical protein
MEPAPTVRAAGVRCRVRVEFPRAAGKVVLVVGRGSWFCRSLPRGPIQPHGPLPLHAEDMRMLDPGHGIDSSNFIG